MAWDVVVDVASNMWVTLSGSYPCSLGILPSSNPQQPNILRILPKLTFTQIKSPHPFCDSCWFLLLFRQSMLPPFLKEQTKLAEIM